jgi:hypothetical protein
LIIVASSLKCFHCWDSSSSLLCLGQVRKKFKEEGGNFSVKGIEWGSEGVGLGALDIEINDVWDKINKKPGGLFSFNLRVFAGNRRGE